jgi:hypothetical protein
MSAVVRLWGMLLGEGLERQDRGLREARGQEV